MELGGEFYIKCGAVIDMNPDNAEAPVQLHRMIQIVDGKIQKVTAIDNFAVPAGFTVLDWSDFTVLPGMIDSHVHPLIDEKDYQIAHLCQSSAYKALKGLKVVQDMLKHGWTTIRIAGDADAHYPHIDIKRCVDQHMFWGPRIVAAGHYLSITGGGGDINFLPHEHAGCFHPDGKIVDGPWDMRKAVREEIKFGSDWIKLLVTGAFMTAHDNPMAVHFTEEELVAAVQEARRLGKDVMAHAHSAAGIKAALQSGVRSVEHATMIDAECVQIMRERNSNPSDPRGECWIVPTLFIGDYYSEKESVGEITAPGKLTSLRSETESSHIQCLRNFILSGMADRVCLGSDFVGWPVNLNSMELECLVTKIGMSPYQAVAAATINAARMLRLEKDIGSIEVGKLADLIALDGNPLANITCIHKVERVIHDTKLFSRASSQIL